MVPFAILLGFFLAIGILQCGVRQVMITLLNQLFSYCRILCRRKVLQMLDPDAVRLAHVLPTYLVHIKKYNENLGRCRRVSRSYQRYFV